MTTNTARGPAPARYRHLLPQLGTDVFLTDGGLETSLIFDDRLDLPDFAAFPLLDTDGGREVLRAYYERYARIAADLDFGLVLETPTWRAHPDRLPARGFAELDLDRLNRAGVELLADLRDHHETAATPIVISGCIGPRHDGYAPARHLDVGEARRYHSHQVAAFADSAADLVTAVTMTSSAEATGITLAAAEAGVPAVVSFTVETDGVLPSGESLAAAVDAVDEATAGYPAYFMVNCAHPTHVEHVLGGSSPRIRGLRANASRLSHAELDEAEELDAGDPLELAQQYVALRSANAALTVLGGCCGTNHRHIGAIAQAARSER